MDRDGNAEERDADEQPPALCRRVNTSFDEARGRALE
jgi:hypothetical protein